jgi:antitoxin component YwqK of YwqJK toxin-antitoxin module
MKKILQFGCFASSVRFGAVVAMVAFLAGCQSDSAGKSVGNRTVEAKFLARLDINRQPLEMDSVEWGSALYFAVKPTARDLYAEDFNSSTYEITDGQTTILAGAFEPEPYTGRVIIKHAEANGAPRLLAQIREGRLVNTGTVTDAAGQRRTEIKYDERGNPKRTQEWDANGTLTASIDHQTGATTVPGGGTPTPSTNPNLPAKYLEYSQVEIRGWLVFDKSEMFFPYDGALVGFHDKAKLQLARVENYSGGKPEGKVTWWHPNGQKHFEADYVDGEPDGLATWWRSDGSTEHEAFWQDAKPKLARATTWDLADAENGKVLNGNGTLVFLHPDGSKRQEAIYTDGALSDEHWWDEEGNALPNAPTFFRVERPRIPSAP